MNVSSVDRPAGVIALSLVLGWLGVAGLANAIFVAPVMSGGFASHMFLTSPRVTGAILCVLAIAYGLTALLAAFGLWRMRTWAPKAYLAWSVVAGGAFAFFALSARVPARLIALLIFGVLVGLLLGAGWLYIRAQIATVRAGAL